MQKINFQNLPTTTTPVNATNLNQVQTNVENAMVEQEYLGNNPDINSLKNKSGIYGLYNCSQAPSNIGSGILEVLAYSSDWVLQRYTDVSNDLWKSWERTYYNGTTWSSWKRIDGYEVELYNNASGSTTTITLNDYLSNYKYIEIFYIIEGIYDYVKVYLPDTKEINLSGSNVFATVDYVKNSKWQCNGNQIVLVYANEYEINSNNIVTNFVNNSNRIAIVRVVGYQ